MSLRQFEDSVSEDRANMIEMEFDGISLAVDYTRLVE